MELGSLHIDGYAALAPMAGVADAAFRRLCVEYGAAFTVSEMVSSKALTFQDRRSRELLARTAGDAPFGIQLFGDDPAIMAEAARIIAEEKPDFIDVNMGCPAPKVAGNHCGSALLREPELCGKIVRAVVDAVDVPVTAKIRKGYAADSVTAVEVAKAVEAGGAAAVTVHGRTRDQMYRPPVDLDIIAAVKRAVSIPVIGNGDVDSPQAAAKMYEQTGCDFLMVGRGALGAPWIFSQINGWLGDERLIPTPPMALRMQTLIRQTRYAIAEKGESVALREARKHAGWYITGMRNAAAFRDKCGAISTIEDLEALCAEVIRANEGKE